MGIDQLDILIRICAATIILLVAGIMYRDRQAVGLPAALFAPLAVCLSAFVLTNSPAPTLLYEGFANDLARFLSGFTVTFLWWFCLSCFDSHFRLRGGILGVGIIWAIIAALDRGALGSSIADRGLSALLVSLGFCVIGHLVWRLIVERSGDLIQSRRDARIVVAILLGGMLFIDLAVDTVYGFGWRPLMFAMAQNFLILAFALWLAAKLLAAQPNVLTFQAPVSLEVGGRIIQQPPSEQPPSEREDELRRRLSNLIDKERIYLDPELTFAAFVEQMGAPERTVRKLVNRDLGYDHFRVFLNCYRVAAARRLLVNPDRADSKLIAIAFDSGFASLASFNRVFRAVEGCSPGEYRTTMHHANTSIEDLPPSGLVDKF